MFGDSTITVQLPTAAEAAKADGKADKRTTTLPVHHRRRDVAAVLPKLSRAPIDPLLSPAVG